MALVIRRGPSKWWHFLLWDRDNGMISPGSWFNGMIYPHRCDLSPRGDWMLILAYNGTNDPCAWTALCHPPNVKAICFFPQSTARQGGGFFDPRQPIIWLNGKDGSAPHEDFCKHGFEIGYQEQDQPPYGSIADRLERDGWKRPSTAKRNAPSPLPLYWVKKSPQKDFELLLELPEPTSLEDYDEQCSQGIGLRYSVRAVGSSDATQIENVEWVNWNRRGEICMSDAGKLYSSKTSNPNGTRKLVVDLCMLTPRIKKEKAGLPPPSFGSEATSTGT